MDKEDSKLTVRNNLEKRQDPAKLDRYNQVLQMTRITIRPRLITENWICAYCFNSYPFTIDKCARCGSERKDYSNVV